MTEAPLVPSPYPNFINYTGEVLVTPNDRSFIIPASSDNPYYSATPEGQQKADYFGGSYELAGDFSVLDTTMDLSGGNVVYQMTLFYPTMPQLVLGVVKIVVNNNVRPYQIIPTAEPINGLPSYAEISLGAPLLEVTRPGEVVPNLVTVNVLLIEVNANATIEMRLEPTDIRNRWNIRMRAVTQQSTSLLVNAFTRSMTINAQALSMNYLLAAGYSQPSNCRGPIAPALYFSFVTDPYGGMNLSQVQMFIYSPKLYPTMECEDSVSPITNVPGWCNWYASQFLRYPFLINKLVVNLTDDPQANVTRKCIAIARRDFSGLWTQKVQERILMYAVLRYLVGYLLYESFDAKVLLRDFTEQFFEDLAASPYAFLVEAFNRPLVKGLDRYFITSEELEELEDCGDSDEEPV